MMAGMDGAGERDVKKSGDAASKNSTNAMQEPQGSAAQWARQNYAPFSHLMFPRHKLDRMLESEAIQRRNAENAGDKIVPGTGDVIDFLVDGTNIH